MHDHEALKTVFRTFANIAMYGKLYVTVSSMIAFVPIRTLRSRAKRVHYPPHSCGLKYTIHVEVCVFF